MTVFRSLCLLPLTLIAQKIAEPSIGGVKSKPEKSQVSRSQFLRLSFSIRPKLLHPNRHDQGAGIIVRGVALVMIRNGEHGMLQHSRLVSHSTEMIQLHRRQTVDATGADCVWADQARVPHALRSGSLEAAHVVLGHTFPDHVA